MRKATSLATATMLLASCSTMSFKEPSEGPRARVRFTTTTESITVVRAYSDIGCESNETEWMRLRNGFLLNSKPKQLGMPLWSFHPNAAKEFYVAPSTYTFLFTGAESKGRFLYSCGVPVHETFEAGHDYELNFIWSPTSCTVEVAEIKQTNGVAARTGLREHSNVATPTTVGCLNQFKKLRLY